MPSTIIANYLGSSLSVVGQDVYYILATDNAGQGAIHHVVIDGTGDAIVVNPAAGAVLLAATAFGDDLFYFQVDDAAGVSPAEHLYRASRLVGGPGVQVGTGTFPGFGIGVVGGGVAGIQALRTRGVFAASGTDIFVNDGSEISRVSLADGTKTVITAPASSGIQFPNLLGATIYYRDLTGNLYSVPAAATTASSAPLGNQTCGQVDTYWMASYPGGFLCSGIYLLYQIDLTGTQKTTILNTLTDKTPIQWNPTSVDGTTYYAVPMGTANSTDPIYRMDTTTGASGVAVTCAVHSVYDYRLTATDLVFIELLGSASGGTMSLRRLPR